MKKRMAITFLVAGVFGMSAPMSGYAEAGAGAGERWPVEKAQAWYAQQPWLVGCDFIPSTAINQLEMWQADTFDPDTIDKELGWAEGIGLNVVRVYLHDLAYAQDPAGFLERMDRFLEIAQRHGIRALFVIFDDCWLADPKPGKQPEPWPGVHNSGWGREPGPRPVGAVPGRRGIAGAA